MKWVLLFLLPLLVFASEENCVDQNGNFDVPRCMVDGNSNGQIEGCSEMPRCLVISSRYVCPTDTEKSLCTSSEWRGPVPYDTDPNNFDSSVWGIYHSVVDWTFSQYMAKLSEFSLSCPDIRARDRLYDAIKDNLPAWVCGGALYEDGWFSSNTCEYVAFDNAQWRVEGECSDPNKVWVKVVDGNEVLRRSNVFLKGIGIDESGSRCNPCLTSINQFVKAEPEQETQPLSEEELQECLNPRFFPGHDRRCRTGGITVLGASCCGITGLFKDFCSRGERELRKKRHAGLCKEIGTYCSKRVFKVCVERKRTYCCFNSRLALVFHLCGREQIGKGWGTPRNPDCSGFSIEEFSGIDFSHPVCVAAIEAWANEIASSMGDRISQDIANRANQSIQDWLQNMRNQGGYGK